MKYQYQSKNYDKLLGIQYLSDQLIKNHFSLYQGYVTNANKLSELLENLKSLGNSGPEYVEIKRRFMWEFDGMRLHEFYFSNMIKGGTFLSRDTNIYRKIVEDFGSYDEWEKDFKNTGMMRGIGWTILYYDPFGDRLYNAWINEHDTGHICGGLPILVMDVFEHAYTTDYGIDKKKYIDNFLKIIDWELVAMSSESWLIK